MVHHELGFLAMLFGISLSFAAGCDDDSLDDESSIVDRDDAAESDINDGEGERTGCARIDSAAECLAQLGCAPMLGTALLDDDNGGWCTDATLQFLGCASTLDTCSDPAKTDCDDPCAAVDITLCEGDSYWRATGCVPDNLTVCEVPGELTGEC